MDFGKNTNKPCVSGVSPNIETKAVRVLITTEDYEIDGFLHIKPGGYQSRVSDILNAKGQQYLPLTNATYRNIRHLEEPARKVETLIVRMDTIKMVAPHNGSELVSRDSVTEVDPGEDTVCTDEGLPPTGTDF
ncbi:MAG: hypothetical protein HZB44_01405 [Actinobacteria bacterium]|nr:hypothetical protein [Actinomycetota bacterium]